MRKFLAFFTAVIMIFSLTACGNKMIKEEEYSKFYEDADAFKNKRIKLSGRVYKVDREQDGMVVQILTDFTNGSGNVLVMLYQPENPVQEGDYVKLEGVIVGKHTAKNIYGDDIVIPKVGAEKFEISSYQDILSPTSKESIISGAVSSQNDVNVSVTKVEFAAAEARVYIEVKNNSQSKITIKQNTAKVSQNGKDIPYQKNHFAGYSELPTEVMAGGTVSGVMTFSKLEASNFKLSLEATSENTDIKFNNFQIDVNL